MSIGSSYGKASNQQQVSAQLFHDGGVTRTQIKPCQMSRQGQKKQLDYAIASTKASQPLKKP